MAKRPDISDFDYGSVVDQIRGQTRRSRPNFLKRNSGRIIDTLIGITDNYQTYKLREKMDNANFENNLELAKLRADASSQIKRNKETSGQYQSLINNGYQFDDPSKGTQQNLQAARKVFGEQAWGTVVSQFPNLLPRASFKSYEDYEAQRNTWGMSDENHEAVENLYNSVVMDKVNYVRSGQAFDFEKFQTNLRSLESMGISIDPDNYGLMSKIGGKLARKLDYQQEQIAAFRNRYLTAEVTKGVEAMEAWTGSTTPEEYYEAVKDTDFGIWASLPQEDAGVLTQLAPGLKAEATEALQKLMHSNPNMGNVEFQNAFNDVVFGGMGRTAATTRFTIEESQARKRINANTNLTEEQKIQQRAKVSSFYDGLKEQYSTLSTDKVDLLLGYKRSLSSITDQMTPLIAKQSDGSLTSTEQTRLKNLKTKQIVFQTSIENIDTPAALANKFVEDALNQRDIDEGKARVANFYTQAVNQTNPESAASVPYLMQNVSYQIANNPNIDEATANRMAALAVTVTPLNKVSDAVLSRSFQNATSDVRTLVGDALQSPEKSEISNVFGEVTEEKLNSYLKYLGPTAYSDPKRKAASLNSSNISIFRYYAEEVLRVNEEAFYKGKQPGFFYGDILQDPTAIRNTITAALVQDFSDYDPKTEITSVRVPTSLEEVANAMYKRHLIFKEASQVVEATDTDETIEEKVNEAEAKGNFSLAERLKAFQLRVAESEKSTSAVTPDEARRALAASRIPASEFTPSYFETPFTTDLLTGVQRQQQISEKRQSEREEYLAKNPESRELRFITFGKNIKDTSLEILNEIQKHHPDHPEYEKVMAELRKRAAAQEDN